jgi:RNA polymerase sigma-70 factor (ECF subfamily)
MMSKGDPSRRLLSRIEAVGISVMTNQPSRVLEGMSDIALLAAFCKRRDATALGELARRYEDLLLGLSRGIIGDAPSAEDAVQEAWVRVIKHGAHFDGRSSFRTWIYRIVINKSLDVRAAKAAAARVAQGEVAGLVSNERVQTQHNQSSEGEDIQRLRCALEELPDSARLVLLLCTHRGLTQEQGAEILGIPLGTLKSRHASAIRQLRAAMGEEINVTTKTGGNQ